FVSSMVQPCENGPGLESAMNQRRSPAVLPSGLGQGRGSCRGRAARVGEHQGDAGEKKAGGENSQSRCDGTPYQTQLNRLLAAAFHGLAPVWWRGGFRPGPLWCYI